MDSGNSWSNILYVIAIAGFGLIKFLLKNFKDKSPKPSKTDSGEQAPKKNVLETLFGELFDVEDPVYPKEEEMDLEMEPVIVEEAIKPTVKKSNLVIEIEDFDMEPSSENANSSLGVEYLDADDFDLKKAVIYSEVINRKYS